MTILRNCMASRIYTFLTSILSYLTGGDRYQPIDALVNCTNNEIIGQRCEFYEQSSKKSSVYQIKNYTHHRNAY